MLYPRCRSCGSGVDYDYDYVDGESVLMTYPCEHGCDDNGDDSEDE